MGGNDHFILRTLLSKLSGGSGIDTYDTSQFDKPVHVDLERGRIRTENGPDSEITDFENFIGSAKADTVSGSSKSNRLLGGDGDDLLYGFGGDDILIGGRGRDKIFDGLGNNRVEGGDGDDEIILYAGINNHDGGADNDYLIGGFQADSLDGGAGNDVLIGDAGDFFGSSDTLTGGKGDDFLMGGKGADTFVFNTNDGNDVIAAFALNNVVYNTSSGYTATATGRDFQSGVDHIQLAGFTTVNSSNVLSFVTSGANGAVFSAEGTEITVYGVDANQLTVDDFIFA